MAVKVFGRQESEVRVLGEASSWMLELPRLTKGAGKGKKPQPMGRVKSGHNL